MPTKSKGPHLWLRKERRNAEGKITHHARYFIKDGGRTISTGCSAAQSDRAEEELRDYITKKHSPQRDGGGDPDRVQIDDVLHIYMNERVPEHAQPAKTIDRIMSLSNFWSGMVVADINERNCRKYVSSRVGTARTTKTAPKVGTAAPRRELEDLRAAVNHYGKDNPIGHVHIWLPPKSQPRQRWLTRKEAATLLRTLWRSQADKAKKHQTFEGEKQDRLTRRHVARFMLVALYTGSRASDVCGAAIGPSLTRGYVDLDTGRFYRKPATKRETNKRRPTITLPAPLLAHIRRWNRKGQSRRYVVEFNDKPVKSIRKAWDRAALEIGLEGVNRHTLRHTAATWLMQNGTDKWQAAGYLGMSMQTLERNYGHHHPDHLQEAATNIMKKPPRSGGGFGGGEVEKKMAKGAK